ncbi:MAG: helicase-related protein, partial [Minisyncoccia bacterium]
IAYYLRSLDHPAVEFHSNRSLNQRREALDGFKKGKYRIVVATDIAARGIDVQNIELVINYDLPTVAEDYVHRIGRTGRAGDAGHAISFASPNQKKDVQAIERLMQKTLPVSSLPALAPALDRTPSGFAPRPPHPARPAHSTHQNTRPGQPKKFNNNRRGSRGSRWARRQ